MEPTRQGPGMARRIPAELHASGTSHWCSSDIVAAPGRRLPDVPKERRTVRFRCNCTPPKRWPDAVSASRSALESRGQTQPASAGDCRWTATEAQEQVDHRPIMHDGEPAWPGQSPVVATVEELGLRMTSWRSTAVAATSAAVFLVRRRRACLGPDALAEAIEIGHTNSCFLLEVPSQPCVSASMTAMQSRVRQRRDGG
jgi:hypothetical protein